VTTTANTAKVQWVKQGVNGYGVGKVLEAGMWEGDSYVAGDFVGIPQWMVAGKDYIDRDRSTSAPAVVVAKKPFPWKLVLIGLGAAVAVYLATRKRSRE